MSGTKNSTLLIVRAMLLFTVGITPIPIINKNKSKVTLVDVRISRIYFLWVRVKF